MGNIIKSIKTNVGSAKYDYNSLANLPSFKTINNTSIFGTGNISINDSPEISNFTENDVYNLIYCENVNTQYILGGLQLSTNGEANALTTRARTNDFINTTDMLISVAENYLINIAFFDSTGQYLGYSGNTYLSGNNICSHQYAPAGATKAKIVVKNSSNSDLDVSILPNNIIIKKRPGSFSPSSTSSATEMEDIPENPGVLNTLLKMKQLRDIPFTALVDLPHKNEYWKAGNHEGMPYSSTRPEALFVPQCVSMYTYMSSLANPNSYLYTIDLKKEWNNENGATYYGAVCSTYCGQALGIKPIYATFQWPYQPNMEIIEPQDPKWLKLGDTFVTKGGGHVLMITGITRNNRGTVTKLEVTDTSSLKPQTAVYTLENFLKSFPPSGYIYCRYKNIHKSKYEQSPFVEVEGETPIEKPVFPPLMPRKGDKSNYLESGYLTSEYVEIDILNGDGYDKVEIYKDDALLFTLDKDAVIKLKTSDLGYGKYKACLSDGTNRSNYCYWMIVNTSTTFEDLKNGKVKLTFNSLNPNVKGVWVQWAGGANNGTKHISEINEEESANGVIECDYPDITNPKVGDSFKIRVAFETEYGVIHGALTEPFTLTLPN